jgi:hypothetical protein
MSNVQGFNAKSLSSFGGGFTAAIRTLIPAVRIKGRNEPFVVLPHYKGARFSFPGRSRIIYINYVASRLKTAW